MFDNDGGLKRSVSIQVVCIQNILGLCWNLYVNLIVLIAVPVDAIYIAFDPHSWWWYRKQTA